MSHRCLEKVYYSAEEISVLERIKSIILTISGVSKKHILSCYIKTGIMSKRHRRGEISSVLNNGGRRYFTSVKNVYNY